jgi:predicted amidophosphoribosyltransferase
MVDDRLVRKPRTCLVCQRKFDSANAGNRICAECALKQPAVPGIRQIRFDGHDEGCDAADDV